MELRIVIFGLFLLIVDQSVSVSEDYINAIEDFEEARHTDVHNVKKFVRDLLQLEHPESFVLVINGTEIEIYNIYIGSDYYGFARDVLAMRGIERALRHSPTETRLWVFIGEPATDQVKYHDVVYLSQKMGNQIYFAILRSRRTSPPDYSVYHDIAAATYGQVFYFNKNETGEVLNYEEHLAGWPKDIVAATTFPPALEGNEFNVTVDNKTSELTIAVTDEDENPKVTVLDPSGLTVVTTYVTKLSAITVVKLPVSPGVYKVRVSSRQETRVVVTASTSVTFQHGFSAHSPSHFNDTTRIPVQGPNHLSILLDNEEGSELRSVQILSMDAASTVLVDAHLFVVDETATPRFYTTDPVTIPYHTFQIAIKLHDASSGTSLTRHGFTPITRLDKCKQPVDGGPCQGERQMWNYDNNLKECFMFAYGGCLGNDNRFSSEEECYRECGAPAPPEPEIPIMDKCQQPMRAGPCRGQFAKWYYNYRLKTCNMFTYSGCLGNGNRFESAEECERECGAFAPVPEMPITDICQQPKDPGPCNGTFQKWYYHKNYQMCLTFEYGGCGGNENRFDTQQECRYQCDLPTDLNTNEHQNGDIATTEKTPTVPLNKTCSQRNDELETFGRYVASSLRKLNEKVAIYAQDEIQAILSKYKLRNLKRTSS